jgi:phage terminase large subunit
MGQATRAVCIREIQRTLAQSSKLLIEDKIRSIGASRMFKIQHEYIEAPYGGRIIFMGMQSHTADSIKALEGYDIAWVDEAHRLSKYSLGLLRPTIRAEGSELWFSWNPTSPEDAVDELFCGPNPPPNSILVEANWDDNHWFPSAAREEMEYDRRRDPERYKHVWLGQYQSRSEARVFHNWKIEEFETPQDAVFYHGADWGFAKDPTVLVRCFVKERQLYVDREVWRVGCEMDHTPGLFDQLEPEVAGNLSHPHHPRRWQITADSSNPQSISYMRRHGYPKIVASVKGPGSVEEGVEFLKSYDIIVHPRCRHVSDELANYRYEVDEHTDQVLPKLLDKKNHTIDALRYAVEGIRRKPIRAMWGSY